MWYYSIYTLLAGSHYTLKVNLHGRHVIEVI